MSGAQNVVGLGPPCWWFSVFFVVYRPQGWFYMASTFKYVGFGGHILGIRNAGPVWDHRTIQYNKHSSFYITISAKGLGFQIFGKEGSGDLCFANLGRPFSRRPSCKVRLGLWCRIQDTGLGAKLGVFGFGVTDGSTNRDFQGDVFAGRRIN